MGREGAPLPCGPRFTCKWGGGRKREVGADSVVCVQPPVHVLPLHITGQGKRGGAAPFLFPCKGWACPSPLRSYPFTCAPSLYA